MEPSRNLEMEFFDPPFGDNDRFYITISGGTMPCDGTERVFGMDSRPYHGQLYGYMQPGIAAYGEELLTPTVSASPDRISAGMNLSSIENPAFQPLAVVGDPQGARPATPRSAARRALSISRRSGNGLDGSWVVVGDNDIEHSPTSEAAQSPFAVGMNQLWMPEAPGPALASRFAVSITPASASGAGASDDSVSFVGDDVEILSPATRTPSLSPFGTSSLPRLREIGSSRTMTRRRARPQQPQQQQQRRARGSRVANRPSSMQSGTIRGYRHACQVHGCDKRFGRPEHRQRHQRTHLPMDQKKVFDCDWPGCRTVCTRGDNLREHVKRVHTNRIGI
ncbi:MAG: hypothetical protein M1815_006097 [Lichina confinis]|nr:MAG: hypothetical protein M1815_006097 [Lichina confinis]